MKYTILVANRALGSARYVGTFASELLAQEYAQAQANRSRGFVSYEVWIGSQVKPAEPTAFRVWGLS